jgi:hypothetical protein
MATNLVKVVKCGLILMVAINEGKIDARQSVQLRHEGVCKKAADTINILNTYFFVKLLG